MSNYLFVCQFQGVPHRLSEDDDYKGYYLPADTMIMANQWSVFSHLSLLSKYVQVCT